MYARLTTFQFHPEKMDEAMQLTEALLPELQRQHGLKSLMRLVDRKTGKAVLVSLFETEADMQSGVNSGFVQQQASKIGHLLAGAPVTEFYEAMD